MTNLENHKKIETERRNTNEENRLTPSPDSPPPDPGAGRSQQLERIRALRQALLPDAMKGDVLAVGAILKCDEREADLLGLYDEKRENRVVFSWLGEDDGRDAARRPVWHTAGQCADFLGVTPKTVRRMVEQGRLPAARTPGGHCRVHREDLERYREVALQKRADKTDKTDKTDGQPPEDGS